MPRFAKYALLVIFVFIFSGSAGWNDPVFREVEILEDHIHSSSRVYPNLTDGVTMTGGAGAWQLGNATQIIPVSTVTAVYDIHYCNIGSASAADVYQVNFTCPQMGSDSLIAQIRISRGSGGAVAAPSPVMTPQLPANARLNAAVASSSGGGDQLVISVQYHTY